MIRRLRIKNFQKHRDLDIKLDPGVTTIVGPTDVGKSAIIRALQWLTLSKMRGTGFIRHGAALASVSLTVDGHKVRRTRGTTNAYYLDAQPFKAFGTKVPDEVSALLNMGPLNFQSQHDAAFWFSLSPGEVSRELNRIVDLGVIDETLKNLAEMSRAAKTEERLISERIQTARDQIKELRPVREAAADLKEVRRLERRLADKAERAQTLRVLVSNAQTHRDRATRLSQALSRGKKVLRMGEAWVVARRRYRNVGALVEDLKKLKRLCVSIPEPLDVEWWANEMRVIRDRKEQLTDLLRETKTFAEEERVARVEIVKGLKQLKEFKVCPACDQKLPHAAH